MIIRVDNDRCSGHARCYAISPELFLLDEVGYSAIDVAEVPEGFEELARQAEASCPERAIQVITD